MLKYPEPTMAEGSDEVLTTRVEGVVGGAAMDKPSVAVAVCAGELVSVAVTPIVKLPLAVGVPERMPVFAARLRPAGSCPEVMVQVYGDVPPLAPRVTVYGAATVPCGSEVVEMATAEGEGDVGVCGGVGGGVGAVGGVGVVGGAGEPVSGAAMTTGTPWDSCMVCVFWTFSCTVAGVERLLLPTVPDKVLASTTVVTTGAPFQRIAALEGKFVPETLSVAVWVPAVMVCGETWLMLGVTAGARSWTFPSPQPTQ
jgi:hypothetical protein